MANTAAVVKKGKIPLFDCCFNFSLRFRNLFILFSSLSPGLPYSALLLAVLTTSLFFQDNTVLRQTNAELSNKNQVGWHGCAVFVNTFKPTFLPKINCFNPYNVILLQNISSI